MNNLQNPLALIGRILLVAIFLWSGYEKLTDFNGSVAYAVKAAHMPMPEVGIVIAIIVEVLFSILLVIGFQARIIGLLMAIYTMATAFFFHTNFADFEQLVNFWKNVAIAGGFLQVAAFGAGAYSLDAKRGH